MSTTHSAETFAAAPPFINGSQLPQLLDAAKHLSPAERLTLVAAVIATLQEDITPLRRERDDKQEDLRLAAAAAALRQDYENDPELTAFTALDGEDFYDYDDYEKK